jgi:hypothetical protein
MANMGFGVPRTLSGLSHARDVPGHSSTRLPSKARRAYCAAMAGIFYSIKQLLTVINIYDIINGMIWYKSKYETSTPFAAFGLLKSRSVQSGTIATPRHE